MSTSARSFRMIDKSQYVTRHFNEHDKALEQRRSAMRHEQKEKEFELKNWKEYGK